MRMQMTGAVVVAATVVALSGCTRGGEPWDNTGYFEHERARSEALQNQLRHRVLHSQIDPERPAHRIEGS